MKKIQKNFDGSGFICEDGSSFPNDKENSTYKKNMKLVEQGKAELIEFSETLTPAEKMSLIRDEIGSYIDNKAKTTGPFGFDNIISAVSYAEDTEDTVNQPYGAALKAWRRQCWDKAREILAAWQSGGDEPTLEEVISQMPEFVEPQ